MERKLLILGIILALLPLAVAVFIWYQQSQVKPETPETKEVQKPVEKKQLFPSPNAFQKGPFTCPSIPQFCQTGRDVFIEKNYIGFGTQLPKDASIFAAFDGEISTTPIIISTAVKGGKTQKINFTTLTNKEKLLRAAYYYDGKAIKNRTVKTGEVIATSSATLMPIYENSSLVFILTRNDPVMGKDLGGERVKLSTKDFK